VLICLSCLKKLENAFRLRSQIRHVENSYFQVRRDEIDDEQHNNESNEFEDEPEIAIKTEAVEQPFAIEVTSTDDPLLEEDLFEETPDHQNDFPDHQSEANGSDDLKDEDYGANTSKKGVGVQCPECLKHLTNPNYLQKHVDNVHSKIKKFSCEICERKFFTKYNLEHHLIRHIKNPQNQVKNMTIDTANKNRPFKCPDCLLFFKTPQALRQHRMIHTDIRPYQCWCGKAFRRNDHLKNHKATHAKKKKKT
jgi:uncharacterized Zn-finger protein